MPIPVDKNKLAELFEELGASAPEGWANSQTMEGINQLHRFLFLRQAWDQVIKENEESWIDEEVAYSNQNPDKPFAGVGHALARMQAKGVGRHDIVDLARGVQAQLLSRICYLLEDPSIEEPSVSDIGWTLVQTDDKFEPTNVTISGLHESVLSTDPTGREMRPRNAP